MVKEREGERVLKRCEWCKFYINERQYRERVCSTLQLDPQEEPTMASVHVDAHKTGTSIWGRGLGKVPVSINQYTPPKKFKENYVFPNLQSLQFEWENI
jgi:hypothetical protein